MRVTKLKANYLAISIISLLYLYYSYTRKIPYFFNVSTFIGFSYYIITMKVLYKKNKEILTPKILLLSSYYAFSNGTLLEVALGKEGYYYSQYISTLSYLNDDIAFYSACCIIFYCLGLIFSETKQKIKFDKLFELNESKCKKNIQYLNTVFNIVLITTFFLLSYKFSVALSGGYVAVRNLSYPKIFGIAEFLYVPFGFLIIILNDDLKLRQNYTKIMYVYFGLTALTGYRTVGISGIISLYYLSSKFKKKKIEFSGNKRKKQLRNVIILILVGCFVNIAQVFRDTVDIKQALSIDHVSVLGLLTGFGCEFPFYCIMNIVPQKEPFMNGMTYLTGFITGIRGVGFDLTGFWHKIYNHSICFDELIKLYYPQYNFGLGFSLNAESYFNFGMLGIFAIFFISYLINRCFVDISSEKININDIYSSTILMYAWFTIARRSSMYIFLWYFKYIILFKVLILSLLYFSRHKF